MKSRMFTLTIFSTLLLISSFSDCISISKSICEVSDDTQTEKTKKPLGITLEAITRHDSVIYERFENEFKVKWNAENPSIPLEDIIWLEISDDAWIRAINSQSRTIDILWGGNPETFNLVANEGYIKDINDDDILEMYENGTLNKDINGSVLVRYNEGDDAIIWSGSSISSYGFTINKNNINTTYGPFTGATAEEDLYEYIPQTWGDLGDPMYYISETLHAIAIADAPATTSITHIYQIILQKFGWEAGWDLITRIAGNSKIFNGGAGPTRDFVTFPSLTTNCIALTIDFYGYTAMIQNPDCEYILPRGESVINSVPIAMPSSCNDVDITQAFIKFVLSPAGQAIWLDTDLNRLPVNFAAFDYAKVHRSNDRQDLLNVFQKTLANYGFQFNGTQHISTYDPVQFYFQAAVTQAQNNLYNAWNSIVNAYRTDEITSNEFVSISRAMSTPPFTLQEAENLQSQYNNDPNIRNSWQTVWKANATERYDSVDYWLVHGIPSLTSSTSSSTAISTNSSTLTTRTFETSGFTVFMSFIGMIIGVIVITRRRRA